jgi:hypothetical protein
LANIEIVNAILEAKVETRQKLYKVLTLSEKEFVDKLLEERIAHPWPRWLNDPVGFVEVGLGETLWSKQREILQ